MQNKKNLNQHEKISEEHIRLFDNEDFAEEIEEDDEDTAGLHRSLMLVDQLIFATPDDDGIRPLLYELRRAILEDEMTFQEARQTIVEMQQVVEKLTAPANRIGTLLGLPKKRCCPCNRRRFRIFCKPPSPNGSVVSQNRFQRTAQRGVCGGWRARIQPVRTDRQDC